MTYFLHFFKFIFVLIPFAALVVQIPTGLPENPRCVAKATHPPPGLYPLFIDTATGTFKNKKISFGGCGDSFYEYLLKVWILTGRKNEQLKTMYNTAMESMFSSMLKTNGEGT